MASTSRILARNRLPRPSPLAGTFDQTGDIDKLDLVGHDLGRLGDPGDGIEPGVGHGDAPDIGIDGAERKVAGLRRASRGQRVEKGRFADIG